MEKMRCFVNKREGTCTNVGCDKSRCPIFLNNAFSPPGGIKAFGTRATVAIHSKCLSVSAQVQDRTAIFGVRYRP